MYCAPTKTIMNTTHNRHSVRVQWHDYNSGIFFVTICAHEKLNLFGEIRMSEMSLSSLGSVVKHCIIDMPSHHKDVALLNHVVMPNHIHFIIAIGIDYISSVSTLTPQYIVPPLSPDELKPSFGCLKPPQHGDVCNDFHHNSRLAVIIRTLKAAVTRLCRFQNSSIINVWQRNYHEHIIRNQKVFENIMNYIDSNVMNWDKDCFYTV